MSTETVPNNDELEVAALKGRRTHQLVNSNIVNEQTELIQDKEMSTCELIGVVFGSSVGNLLEWFDFAMFGLLADEIGANFFPSDNTAIQTLASFALFSGAFFMRPLGGILFGYIGDKYGRITSLRISLFMMAIPTFLTGCLPNYSTIGVAAPILLTIFRLVQGLSVGGEFTGAITYVLEVSPANRKALYNTLVNVSGSGTLIGTFFVGALRAIFSAQQMEDFMWRIPFFFGILVAVTGFWMRSGLKQSEEFWIAKESGQILENPVHEVMKNHKFTMLSVILHLGYSAASYYLIYIWLPEYAYYKEINPVHDIYLINGVNMIINMCVMIASAYVIDRYFDSNPVFNLMIFGAIGCVYSLLIFPFVSEANTIQILLIQMLFAIIGGIYVGGWSLWGIQRFKHHTVIRYTGFGISYNIALALFGGTSPLIAAALVMKYDTWTLGVLLFVYGVIAVTTNAICYFIVDKNDKSIQMMNVSMDELEPFRNA